MTIRASRGMRLLVAVAMAWLGLALYAQAAHATYGKVQIAKINQGGNASDTFAFHPELTPAADDFALEGGATSDKLKVECNIDRPTHPGECTKAWGNVTLTVTEAATPGYTLTDIACRYTQGDNDFAGEPDTGSQLKPDTEVTKNLADGSVTLSVHFYEWVKCWYTNTRWYTNTPTPPTPPTTPTPTTPAPPSVADSSSPAVQPQIVVSPVRVQPGSATVRGPSGCPTNTAAAATVSGRRIVKVTFYVDGKKVKTLTHPNRKSTWVLANARRFAFGTHRVRVTIQFARSSQTKTKTLRLSFSRCRPANVRPKFTG